MRKATVHFLLLILISTSACQNESSKKVDVQSNIDTQAKITITSQDGTKLTGILNEFCSAELCMDYGEPDWSAFKFTPYRKGTTLEVDIETGKEVANTKVWFETIDGSIVQNNVALVENTITPNFTDTGSLLLSIKLKFTNGDYQTVLFPLEAKMN